MMASTPNKPPAVGHIDRIIHAHKGSTVAIDALPESIQAAKSEPTPSLSQIVEIMTQKNGEHRAEIDYRTRMQELGEIFEEEVNYAMDRLSMALINFRQWKQDIERNTR
jgi:ubiquitin-protein ligase